MIIIAGHLIVDAPKRDGLSLRIGISSPGGDMKRYDAVDGGPLI